ncbi:glycosyltransferase family 2 protein [Candidatus Thioglobus sp.]|nr:glycosyltransferase family 2 protein [Candidatus Thioglobus sp.]
MNTLTTTSKISIVTTMYESEKFVEEFYSRALATVKKITSNYEFVFIDDGSPDNSSLAAKKLEGPVKVVRFSKNFGHHNAMMAACAHATGDFIFLIDIDLEESPELLLDFWHSINSDDDLDVCFGIQKKRKGRFLERTAGNLFYRVFNFLSDIEIPRNLLTIRLMSQRYVDALLQHKETDIFIGGLWEISGFNQKRIAVNKLNKGATTYHLKQKVQLLLNSITSFSSKPLYLIFYISAIILTITFIYSAFIFYMKLTHPNITMGYSSLLISVWFFGGLILFNLSIIGIYVAKIFKEVKKRPSYIIKEIFEKK